MRVSKKQATNARTGRLKKGYKAVKGGYVKVSAGKPAKRKTTTRKASAITKIKRACKKLTRR